MVGSMGHLAYLAPHVLRCIMRKVRDSNDSGEFLLLVPFGILYGAVVKLVVILSSG